MLEHYHFNDTVKILSITNNLNTKTIKEWLCKLFSPHWRKHYEVIKKHACKGHIVPRKMFMAEC